MKAITLWEPWAWAVAYAGKWIENRTWRPPRTAILKPIAIHASTKALDGEAIAHLRDVVHQTKVAPVGHRFDDGQAYTVGTLGFGHIVAVGWLAGWIGHGGESLLPFDTVKVIAGSNTQPTARQIESNARWSPWFTGPVGWILAQVTRLPEPIRARSRQGLWDLEEEAEVAILSQLDGFRNEPRFMNGDRRVLSLRT